MERLCVKLDSYFNSILNEDVYTFECPTCAKAHTTQDWGLFDCACGEPLFLEREAEEQPNYGIPLRYTPPVAMGGLPTHPAWNALTQEAFERAMAQAQIKTHRSLMNLVTSRSEAQAFSSLGIGSALPVPLPEPKLKLKAEGQTLWGQRSLLWNKGNPANENPPFYTPETPSFSEIEKFMEALIWDEDSVLNASTHTHYAPHRIESHEKGIPIPLQNPRPFSSKGHPELRAEIESIKASLETERFSPILFRPGRDYNPPEL